MKGGGLGIVGVLQIVFLVLKLAGVVSWSWLWVLAPLWISAVLSGIVLAIVGVVFVVVIIAGIIAACLNTD